MTSRPTPKQWFVLIQRDATNNAGKLEQAEAFTTTETFTVWGPYMIHSFCDFFSKSFEIKNIYRTAPHLQHFHRTRPRIEPALK